MSKKHTKGILLFTFIIAAMMIWAFSIYNSKLLNEQYSTVSVRIQSDGVSAAKLKTALSNELVKDSQISDLTAWNQTSETEVTATGTKHQVSVKEYEVLGDCSQVYPMEFVDGANTISEDYQGCVLDENTAYELFGTKYAVGNTLIDQNKTYYVRGIVKAKVEMLIIQIRDIQHKYVNLEFTCKDSEKGADSVKAFFLQNGIEVKYTILEGAFYAKIAGMVSQFPLWFLVLVIIKKSIKGLFKYKRMHWISFLYFGIGLLFIVGVLWLSELKPYWPERLTPSTWSDLSFWVEKYKGLKGFINDITYLTPLPKDVILLNSFKRNIVCSFISCINIMVLLVLEKIQKEFNLSSFFCTK